MFCFSYGYQSTVVYRLIFVFGFQVVRFIFYFQCEMLFNPFDLSFKAVVTFTAVFLSIMYRRRQLMYRLLWVCTDTSRGKTSSCRCTTRKHLFSEGSVHCSHVITPLLNRQRHSVQLRAPALLDKLLALRANLCCTYRSCAGVRSESRSVTNAGIAYCCHAYHHRTMRVDDMPSCLSVDCLWFLTKRIEEAKLWWLSLL